MSNLYEFITFSFRLEIKIKMEASQIIGEELLKRRSIFQKKKHLKRKELIVLKIDLA